MSLVAFDSNSQLTEAKWAKKQRNYYCVECKDVVRVRGGPYRQCHFYHVHPTHCRQNQKGIVHYRLQWYFLDSLPTEDCKIEHPFPSVGRIADVAWFSKKIVFEIQYSPISAEEVFSRNRDYRQEGWEIVWILHDRRYNQFRLTAAEMALRSSSYYYTNMDEKGKGCIYDQFDVWKSGFRYGKMSSLPIDINEPFVIPGQRFSLAFLQERANKWKMAFSGDLSHIYLNRQKEIYLLEAGRLERKFLSQDKKNRFFRWKPWVRNLYQTFFRSILERIAR